jgi:hypothetical protein
VQPTTTNGGAPVGAGTISVTDLGVSVDDLLFDPVAGYPSDAVGDWTPGDALVAKAHGGTVGAFKGSVTAPGPLADLNPPYDAFSGAPVPLGQGLVLSWTPAGADKVSVLFPAASGGTVTCTVADSAGKMTIPASMLAYAQTGSAVSFDFERQTVVQAAASNATVAVVASYNEIGTAVFGGCGDTGWPCQSNAECCSASCTVGTCD